MDYSREAPPPFSRSEGSFDSLSESFTSSRFSSNKTAARRQKASVDEALLLSQATSQAMIAARSIVLSGGSQQTALSTAKAAAQSILVSNPSDSDTITGTGKSFLGRRKAKRQAEIVASMALLSVNNAIQAQQSGSPYQPNLQWDASMLVQQRIHSLVGIPNDASYVGPSESLVGHQSARSKNRRKSGNGEHRRKKGSRMQILMPTSTSQALPEPRSRAKDITARVPNTEPIYYASTSRAGQNQDELGQGQFSSSSEDEYYSRDDSTVGDSTIATNSFWGGGEDAMNRKVHSKKEIRGGCLQSSVDPLLFSLTNAFNCGLPPSCTAVSSRKTRSTMAEARDDDCEDDEQPEPHTKAQMGKARVDAIVLERSDDSESSASSAGILRDLWLKSSKTGRDLNNDTKKKMKSPKNSGEVHASMEEVVLRALSVRQDEHQDDIGREIEEKLRQRQTERQQQQQPATEATSGDPILRSRFDRHGEVFTGVHSSSAAPKTTIKIIGSPKKDTGAPSSPRRRKSRLQTFISVRKKNRETNNE